MQTRAIASMRLANQQIQSSTSTTVAAVVSHLTAMQAQDYRGALWSIGLRLPGSTIAQVERAIAERSIVRTWPMRGTLHFVAAADVRWMLRLLTPRVLSGSAGRARQLELDAAVFARSSKVFEKALRDGAVLTRPEMYEALERARISPAGQRGIHILSHLSQHGLLCFAAHQGKQPAFALLDEWIPKSRALARDEALAELTERYFRSHGPATLRDFAWWSGLTLTDARAGLAAVSSMLTERVVKGVTYLMSRNAPDVAKAKRSVHLLPGFDEYMLGYSDRSIALDPARAQAIVPGNNGMFMPTIVAGGRIVGTWRTATSKGKLAERATPFAPLSARDDRALAAATKDFERFVGTPPAAQLHSTGDHSSSARPARSPKAPRSARRSVVDR